MYADSLTISHSPDTAPSRRVIVSRVLSACVVVLIIAYMGMMVKTISLVNDRKDIRTQIRDTQVAVSDLEVKYFNLAQSIDQAEISRLGFTDSTTPVFAYTNPAFPTVAIR